MGLLARVLRTSGPTHGRPLYSSLQSPEDVVPMVPILVKHKSDKFILCFLMYPSMNHTLLELSITILDRHIPLV
jgi:hypothetical protein